MRGFDRRMTPAMDSCTAFSERLAIPSQRINRRRLLRTQTELVIQRQQRFATVTGPARQTSITITTNGERLSIAAVTYYGVGLVGYIASVCQLTSGACFAVYQSRRCTDHCAGGVDGYSQGQTNCNEGPRAQIKLW